MKPRHIGDVLQEASMERVMAIACEIQAELDSLRTCPAACADGTVHLSPPSGRPQRSRCPLLSPLCPYGSGLGGKLDAFLNKTAIDAGIPRRYVEGFDAYIETPALAWANRWGFRDFLVLSGSSGAGKSFGAAWAAKEYLRSRIPDSLDVNTWNRALYAGERILWSTANRIIHDSGRLAEICGKWLLVLDDLGKEGDSPTRRADVGGVISERYDAKLPTVITTELSFGDILKTYGRHTAYKLIEDNGGEMGGGMFVNCGDFSLRQEADGIKEALYG